MVNAFQRQRFIIQASILLDDDSQRYFNSLFAFNIITSYHKLSPDSIRERHYEYVCVCERGKMAFEHCLQQQQQRVYGGTIVNCRKWLKTATEPSIYRKMYTNFRVNV